MDIPDVDLDVAARGSVLGHLRGYTTASQLSSDKAKLVPHNTGVYFQKIPTDPTNNLASFPYDEAEALGYYKVDLIPYHIYEGVDNEDHLTELLSIAESDDYPWDWFLDHRFFDNTDSKLQITHLARHREVVDQYPPKSVMDVATLIALIRPRKKYLIGRSWDEITDVIWKRLPEEETGDRSYFFKKSHAVAFALVVMIHLLLLQPDVAPSLLQHDE